MSARRAASVIEAAYRWADDERDWLAGIVEAAKPFEVGSGIVGCTIDLGQRSKMAQIVTDDAARTHAPAIVSITNALDPSLARAMYAPTEFAGNAAWRLDRVTSAVGTRREHVEERAGCALPPMWAVIGGNPDVRSVALAFPSRKPLVPEDAYPHRDGAKHLGLLGAHLGAALRLRAAISPPSANDAHTEAVLTPDGKVLHATGAARGRSRSLAAAAARTERARLRRTTDGEALSLWKALVDGRWTIIDVEERDGKRLVLARRNMLGARDVAALDDAERDVAWLASMGHSHKYIAYELGFSEASVVRRLTSALAKLGFKSRRDLVRFFSQT